MGFVYRPYYLVLTINDSMSRSHDSLDLASIKRLASPTLNENITQKLSSKLCRQDKTRQMIIIEIGGFLLMLGQLFWQIGQSSELAKLAVIS